jgi:ABC-type Fe3+/spermidine/putrescine transport system ATPase subunit
MPACIRPESLVIRAAAEVAEGAPALRGVVAETTYLGGLAQHKVDCAGTSVSVLEINPRHLSRRGEPVALTVDAAQVAMLGK